VADAWKSVKQAGGTCGHDGVTIEDVENDLDGQLYKIWNRMSSGSYMAAPVLLVNIPKAKGGVRQLGIPTVCDRIAQNVVKKRLESVVDGVFSHDSYAYRPNKSAIDAVSVCRQRCFDYEWVVEVDIKGFFDNINHDMLYGMLEKYTDDKLVFMYCKRFLKAKGLDSITGEESERTNGTPQGGVVSPILANLFLHEAIDVWLTENFKQLKFERYADDIIVHCVSEKQAEFVRNKIMERLQLFDLELNLEKTRVVYTGTSSKLDYKKHELNRKFTFLGYDFKPRWWKGKVIFTPGMSSAAMKIIRTNIKTKWKLKKRLSDNLENIAYEVNSTIRGWINYYGHFRRSELYKLAYMIDNYLARFLKRKHDLTSWKRAWEKLSKLKVSNTKLFDHWYTIKSSERRAV
jgi:RNA-directed DNA polymerase